MHTLFMIEMSVRKTMPLSGSFLALFLMQQKFFHQERRMKLCLHKSHSWAGSQQTLKSRPVPTEPIISSSMWRSTKVSGNRNTLISTSASCLGKLLSGSAKPGSKRAACSLSRATLTLWNSPAKPTAQKA